MSQCSSERPIEVEDDVVDVLDADADAHQLGQHAGRLERLVGELAVRGRAGVDDERARVADVGQVRAQLDAADERLARLAPALAAEGEHRARALAAGTSARARGSGRRAARRSAPSSRAGRRPATPPPPARWPRARPSAAAASPSPAGSGTR